MKSKRERAQIAHIFHGEFPHLTQSMGVSFAQEEDVKGRIYLRDGWQQGEAELKRLMPAVFAQQEAPVVLSMKRQPDLSSPSLFVRRVRLFSNFNFTIGSLWRLIWGPKILIFHNTGVLHFFPMLLLRLFGHTLIVVHFGGCPWESRFVWLCYRQFKRIVVLMSPEVRYFQEHGLGDRVVVQSYYRRRTRKYPDFTPANNAFAMLLGNNTWSREAYRGVLEHIPQEHCWESIVCMLNYGDETGKEKTDQFIQTFSAHLGKAFTPWTEVVPYEAYCATLRKVEFYLCPALQQTGLGALYTCIYMGKTCLLAGDNLTWVRSLGMIAHDLSKLTDFSQPALAKLILTDEQKSQNRERLIAFFETHATPSAWRRTVLENL